MKNLKTINELKDGEVTVVCSNGKQFHGSYSEEFQCVYFAIPSSYEIAGYIQD